jgi:hypothetical protein
MAVETSMPWSAAFVPRSRLIEAAKPYAIYLTTILIFASSRAVVIAGVNFGKLLVPDESSKAWHLGQQWHDRLLRFDSGFYIEIAKQGYRHSLDPAATNSTAFYPLYPLLGHVVTAVTGIQIGIALLLIANIAALIACLLMTKLIKDELGEEIAAWSIAFFLFFPSAFFLSAGYTESLCLVFVLLCLIVLMQERFVLAAVFAGLAVATRSTGIVLLPIILLEIYRHRGASLPQTALKMAMCGLIAASSLIAFMAYLGWEFGHPLAFAESQSAWHQGTFESRFWSAITLSPIRRGGWFLLFFPLAVLAFWRLRPTLALYGLGVLLLPYLTLGITHSMCRFALMCFPAFIVMALLCKSRPLLATLIIAVFSAYLFQQSALFSQSYWVG